MKYVLFLMSIIGILIFSPSSQAQDSKRMFGVLVSLSSYTGYETKTEYTRSEENVLIEKKRVFLVGEEDVLHSGTIKESKLECSGRFFPSKSSSVINVEIKSSGFPKTRMFMNVACPGVATMTRCVLKSKADNGTIIEECLTYTVGCMPISGEEKDIPS
jgi:hypothetical protein